MSLKEFIDLYDNWNNVLVVNDRDKNLFATVRLINISNWLREYPSVAAAKVMSFGFYDGEICVRVDI